MTTFTCPVHDQPVRLDHRRLLSGHTTSAGRVAYFRCACDGIVVADPSRGHVTGHATGPDQQVGPCPAPAPADLRACA